MKKFVSIFLALFIILGFYAPAISGTIGNPNPTVQNRKGACEFNLDFTSRDLEDEGGGEGEVESTRVLFKGTYGFDPLNLFVKLGMANAEIEEVKGDYGFAMGLGFNATVYNMPNAKIGVGIQYLTFSSEDTIEDQNIELDISSEIDIFAGASFVNFGNIIPYSGLLISMVDGEARVEGFGSTDVEQADSVGFFFGADYSGSEQFKAGAELRLLDETSFSFNLRYLF